MPQYYPSITITTAADLYTDFTWFTIKDTDNPDEIAIKFELRRVKYKIYYPITTTPTNYIDLQLSICKNSKLITQKQIKDFIAKCNHTIPFFFFHEMLDMRDSLTGITINTSSIAESALYTFWDMLADPNCIFYIPNNLLAQLKNKCKPKLPTDFETKFYKKIDRFIQKKQYQEALNLATKTSTAVEECLPEGLKSSHINYNDYIYYTAVKLKQTHDLKALQYAIDGFKAISHDNIHFSLANETLARILIKKCNYQAAIEYGIYGIFEYNSKCTPHLVKALSFFGVQQNKLELWSKKHDLSQADANAYTISLELLYLLADEVHHRNASKIILTTEARDIFIDKAKSTKLLNLETQTPQKACHDLTYIVEGIYYTVYSKSQSKNAHAKLYITVEEDNDGTMLHLYKIKSVTNERAAEQLKRLLIKQSPHFHAVTLQVLINGEEAPNNEDFIGVSIPTSAIPDAILALAWNVLKLNHAFTIPDTLVLQLQQQCKGKILTSEERNFFIKINNLIAQKRYLEASDTAISACNAITNPQKKTTQGYLYSTALKLSMISSQDVKQMALKLLQLIDSSSCFFNASMHESVYILRGFLQQNCSSRNFTQQRALCKELLHYSLYCLSVQNEDPALLSITLQSIQFLCRSYFNAPMIDSALLNWHDYILPSYKTKEYPMPYILASLIATLSAIIRQETLSTNNANLYLPCYKKKFQAPIILQCSSPPKHETEHPTSPVKKRAISD